MIIFNEKIWVILTYLLFNSNEKIIVSKHEVINNKIIFSQFITIIQRHI